MPAIEIRSLYKEFFESQSLLNTIVHPFRKRNRKIVLNSVDLEIKNNELFCLIGPNGAGKTTLIKILCTLILPTSGSALVNGHDIVKDGKNVRSSIGFVSGEERSFFWRLSGIENLRFFAVLNNIPSRQISQEINRVMDIAGIDEPEKRFQEYSAGARQRLAIARALLREPDILFMDEPTKSLDPLISVTFRKFIKEELVSRHKKTVFFTTHQLEEAKTLADRLAILHQGEIRGVGTLKELRLGMGRSDEVSIEDIFSHYINKG